MATTINNYSVGLSLEASDYIRNSKLSRSETGRLVREINGARTPADNYTRSLNLLDKSLKQGAIDQATYNRLLESAAGKFKHVAVATQTYGSQMQGLAIATKATVAAYVAFEATNAVKNLAQSFKALSVESFMLSGQILRSSATFEVLVGSASKAQTLMLGLKQLAAQTPLSFMNTQDAAKVLLSFGVANEEILPTLKRLGDVTGGNSDRFKMMALAFAQMSAAGRMMGQDLLQMINAGFNPLQQISKTTGESLVELKKRMEDGAISSQEIMKALIDATSAGGMFFGMIDRQAKTSLGKLDMLLDKLNNVKIAYGDMLQPAGSAAIDFASANLDMLMTLKSQAGKAGSIGKAIAGDFFEAQFNSGMNHMFNPLDPMTWPRLRDLRQKKREGMTPGMSQVDPSYVPDWFDASKSAPDYSASAGIESAIQSTVTSVGSMASTVLSGLSTFQDAAEMISMAGVAQTQELVTSMKESPAIKNLQVGTQEAYAALTQATSEAEKSSRLEARRQQQLAENAAAQRNQMNIYLERMNQALENNGFKRIR